MQQGMLLGVEHMMCNNISVREVSVRASREIKGIKGAFEGLNAWRYPEKLDLCEE